MKKLILIISALLVSATLSGCTILTPPAVGWSSTRVEQEDGQPPKTVYTRTIFGGIGDKESSDRAAGAGIMLSGVASEKTMPTYKGIVTNRSSGTAEIKITGNGCFLAFVLKPGTSADAELPAGMYRVESVVDGRHFDRGEVRVRPNAVSIVDGKKSTWFVEQRRI
jgi:hypothetical protein